MRKTWREKMNPGSKPKLVILPKPYMGAPAGAKMLVATPEIIRDYMRAIPYGQTKTVKEMREEVARAHKAQISCPTSSGIFVRIAAEATLEELSEGMALCKVAPFWRLIDPDSPAASKLSCGADFIRERRASEQPKRASHKR